MKGHSLLLALLVSLCCIHCSQGQSKSCGNVPNGSFVPNRANCHYFFLCVNGEFMQLQCTPYSVFDPIEEICRENCDAPLPPTTPTPTPPTPTPGTIPTAGTPPTTPSTAPTIVIPTAPTVGPPNTDDACYNLPNGSYVAIPNSCMFLYCLDGKGLTSQCPDGFCFDAKSGRCVPV